LSRILLADDNPALLAAAGRLLREQGHEVTSTNSGADAVCLLAAKPPPDLLLLDIIMPAFDGRQVLKALGPSAPPVILITGSPITLEDFERGKVVRVLIKPFDATALLNAVEDVIGKPQGLIDTTKEDCVEMTDDQRDKAHERYRRLNGGPAHATG
jgi:two-component system, NtrC family, response regulator GlrR